MKCIKCGKEMRCYNDNMTDTVSIDYMICDNCNTTCEIEYEDNKRKITFEAPVSEKYEVFESQETTMSKLIEDNSVIGFNNMEESLDSKNKTIEEVYNDLYKSKIAIECKSKNNEYIIFNTEPIMENNSIMFKIKDIDLNTINREEDLLLMMKQVDSNKVLATKLISRDLFIYGDKVSLVWSIEKA